MKHNFLGSYNGQNLKLKRKQLGVWGTRLENVGEQYGSFQRYDAALVNMSERSVKTFSSYHLEINQAEDVCEMP